MMGMLNDFDEGIANLLQTEEGKPSVVASDEFLAPKQNLGNQRWDVKMMTKAKKQRRITADKGLKKKKDNRKTKQIKSVRQSSK